MLAHFQQDLAIAGNSGIERRLGIEIRVDEPIIEFSIAIGPDVAQQLFGGIRIGLGKETGGGHLLWQGIHGIQQLRRESIDIVLGQVCECDRILKGQHVPYHQNAQECDRHDDGVASIARLASTEELAHAVRFKDGIGGQPQDDHAQADEDGAVEVVHVGHCEDLHGDKSACDGQEDRSDESDQRNDQSYHWIPVSLFPPAHQRHLRISTAVVPVNKPRAIRLTK